MNPDSPAPVPPATPPPPLTPVPRKTNWLLIGLLLAPATFTIIAVACKSYEVAYAIGLYGSRAAGLACAVVDSKLRSGPIWLHFLRILFFWLLLSFVSMMLCLAAGFLIGLSLQ